MTVLTSAGPVLQGGVSDVLDGFADVVNIRRTVGA